jgi:hypothetical protein
VRGLVSRGFGSGLLQVFRDCRDRLRNLRRPSGALRRPLSAASQKWVLSRALQELTGRVQAIVASSDSMSAIRTVEA